MSSPSTSKAVPAREQTAGRFTSREVLRRRHLLAWRSVRRAQAASSPCHLSSLDPNRAGQDPAANRHPPRPHTRSYHHRLHGSRRLLRGADCAVVVAVANTEDNGIGAEASQNADEVTDLIFLG